MNRIRESMKKRALFILFSVGVLCLANVEAHASHFRYGNVDYRPVLNSNGNATGAVEFHIKEAWRRSAFFSGSTATIGQTFIPDTFFFGDGGTTNITLRVTSESITEDWVAGEMTVQHTYTSAGPYTAYSSNCCRIFALNNGSSGSWRFDTIVSPFSTNNSPTSSLVPIVNVPASSNASFFVPASDLDRDPLRFRIASQSETLIPGVPNLSINSTTGLVTWNNVGLDQTNYWSTQIIIEDLNSNGNVKSKTAVDILLKIVQVTGVAPSCLINGSGSAQSLSVAPGTHVSFTVTGTDPDINPATGNPDTPITLNVSGLPTGATMNPTLQVTGPSPVSSTFNWTPTNADGGTHVITFSATDNTSLQALNSMSIFVETNQPPTITCPSVTSAEATSSAGASVALPVQVQDPNGDALTVSWSVDGNALPPVSVLASMAASTVTLSSAYTIGHHTVSVSVSDGKAASVSCSTNVDVVDTKGPVLSLPANPSLEAAGSTTSVTYSASATDVVDGPVAVQCSPSSGSGFQLGSTVVQCSATDSHGNVSTGNFQVNIVDTIAPSLTVPTNIVAEATSAAGAVVNYTASAKDVVSGNVPMNCSPASGSTFPLGNTTVQCSAQDGAGNTSSGGFSVTVRDMTAPSISNLPGTAQAFDWVNVSTGGAGPSARIGHRMVYDPVRHKVILFGGHAPNAPHSGNYVSASHLNDVWEFDTGSNTWTNVTPTTGNMPVGRSDFGMAYDITRNKVVISGGEIDGWQAGDTWEWDPATRTWEAKPGASSLVYGGLLGSGMAYDPNRHEVILFGGHAYYNWGEAGTWAWDGNNWTNITPSSSPPPRFLPAMATDLARSRVVMFGGQSPYSLNDTWEWDGSAWTQVALSGSSPSARSNAGTAYDVARHVTVLFGGGESGDHNDTWEWNGAVWKLTHPPTTPSARATSMVYDDSQSRLVFFSGVAQADTWFSRPMSSITAEATGPNGAPVTWNSPTVTDTVDGSLAVHCVPPSGSTFALGSTTVQCMATDSHGNTGRASFTVTVQDTTPPAFTAHADITTEAMGPNGAVVTYAAPTATDLVDGSVAVTCNPPSGSTFPLGSTAVQCSATDARNNTARSSFKVIVQDTIAPVISGLPSMAQSLNWFNTNPNTPKPSARSGHRMVYDSNRHRVVLFGGSDATGRRNDIWEYDVAANTWTNVTPSSGSMPIPRSSFGMAYDIARSKIVIYGGQVDPQYSNVSITGDTWEWDSATRTWAQKSASTIVYVGLWGAELTYDPNLQQVILFGGRPYWVYPENGGTYAWNGTDWILKSSTGPIGRVQHALASDTSRSKIVLFGGFTYQGVYLQDTWEWNGTAWTEFTLSGSKPSARRGHAMAYHIARQTTVLFGGDNLNDTWEWNGTSWTQLMPQTNPSRRGTAMAYDASQSKLVIFGGAGQGDTWRSDQLAAITVEATDPSGTVVSWNDPAAADIVDGNVPVVCNPASGRRFPLGITTVQCTATDAHGNTGRASFSVTVEDTTPPVISGVPSDITATATSSAGAVVNYSNPTATDIVDGTLPVNCSPASGSTFPIGQTAVHCVATDVHGNRSSANFNVSVRKADQTIAFSALANKTFGDADFTVSATASSGLAISLVASGKCTVSGATVHITAARSCTITASQGGNGIYNAASDVSQSFNIGKASSTTTITVSDTTYDGSPHGGAATVTGVGGLSQSLTLTYGGRNATSYGPSTTAPTNAGDYTASASFTGDDNHDSSSEGEKIQKRENPSPN